MDESREMSWAHAAAASLLLSVAAGGRTRSAQRLSLDCACAAALELDEAPKLPEFSEMPLAPKG